MASMRVGVLGCGNIAPIYLKNLGSFEETEVVAVADTDPARAKSRAEEYGIAQALSPDQLLADSDVELVLNLTPAGAHYATSKAALEAGKHVYTEKPLATTNEEAAELVALAEGKGLSLGCAPDTVLGAGIQTCRRLIDDGAIGEVVGVQAFMMGRGPEGWHPDPDHFYKAGGGPLFDMGPYYVTALVTLLGPIARASGLAKITFPTRTIGSEKRRGEKVPVEVPTHVTSLFELASGVPAQLTTSFDVAAHRMPCYEIYGSKGTLAVPDPNTFGGPVKLWAEGKDWEEVPLTHPWPENGRGLGLRDLIQARSEGRTGRCDATVAQHVLAAMWASLSSSEAGRTVAVEPQISRPDAMPGL